MLQPTKTHLIGLTGPAGSGKSTVAGWLCERWSFEHIAFADPIVNMIGQLFDDAGIDGAWMVERSLKETPTHLGFSYRRLAQTLGTEWGRQLIHEDLWVRVASHKVAQLREQGDHVVLSDVRFRNEADWIRRQGGIVVRIDRRGLTELPNDASRHISENALAHFQADAVLFNHGSVATLEDQIDRLVESLRSNA